MTPIPERQWPTLDPLGPVQRLAVLAASLPGVAIGQRTVPRPVEEVWAFLAELDRSIPAFDPLVRQVDVVERDDRGRPTEIVAHPGRVRFRVDLDDGWCLMQARRYLVGMAAEASGGGTTLVAHMEGIPRPAGRWAGAVAGPLLAATAVVHRRTVRADLDGMARLLG